jgi:hypothetical protein
MALQLRQPSLKMRIHSRSHSWPGAGDLHSIPGQRSSAGNIELEMRAYIKWLESNLIVERESSDEQVSRLQDISLRLVEQSGRDAMKHVDSQKAAFARQREDHVENLRVIAERDAHKDAADKQLQELIAVKRELLLLKKQLLKSREKPVEPVEQMLLWAKTSDNQCPRSPDSVLTTGDMFI